MEENKEKKEKTGFVTQGRSMIITVTATLSAIICVSISTDGLVGYRKSGEGSGVTATGSAGYDFESDLIVWRDSFSVHSDMPKDACAIIKKNAELVRQYLGENQVVDDEMISSSVNVSRTYTSRYDKEDKYLRDGPNGYDLTQSLTVSSYDIDRVENISRDITKLIELGVELESELPEHYYTKLDEVKPNLIERATANARERIDIIFAGSRAKAGELLSVILGVFQIAARNPGSESHSYDGYLSTSSQYKTVNITAKLNYATEQAARSGR